MEKIVIVAHGTYEDNSLENFAKKVATKLKKQENDVKYAYIQFGKPSLSDAIEACLNENATRIIIHPLFIFSSGRHVTKDIPSVVENFKKKYPHISIICTEPLGLDENLIEIIKGKIESAKKTYN